MRMRFELNALAPLCLAGLLVGCGYGSDRQYEDRRGQLDETGRFERVELTGCVQASPGTEQYVLANVRMAHPAEQPQADQTIARGPLVTEGSWVRLTGEPGLIEAYMGEEVNVMGTLTLDDARQIGTTGEPDGTYEAGPGRERSRADGPEHHAEREKEEMGPIGQEWLAAEPPPTMQVQRIDGTGQECPTDLHPYRR